MNGLKHDSQKPRWELLPLDAVEEVVKVLTFGAKKYGEDNWKKVRPRTRYSAALLRHMKARKCGERLDPESGLLHAAHEATNALFLVWMELHKR